MFKEADFLIARGKLFHTFGAAQTNTDHPVLFLFFVMGFAITYCHVSYEGYENECKTWLSVVQYITWGLTI